MIRATDNDNDRSSTVFKHEIYPGQILRLTAPKAGSSLVKVLKVNPKNIKVQKENGETWNVSPSFLSLPAEGETFETAPAAARLVMGSVVRFTSERMPTDLFVVLGQHGEGYRLAKLGGDNNRYYRGIYPTQVEVVDFALSGV